MREIVPALKARLPGLLRRPYVTVFVLLALGMVVVGLDNPTGIVLGWLAVTALMVPLVWRWQRPWHFLALLGACFFGAILLSCLYSEVAVRLAEWVGGAGALESTAWMVFHTVISNLILLVVPVGLVIGLFGFLVLGMRCLLGRLSGGNVSRGT